MICLDFDIIWIDTSGLPWPWLAGLLPSTVFQTLFGANPKTMIRFSLHRLLCSTSSTILQLLLLHLLLLLPPHTPSQSQPPPKGAIKDFIIYVLRRGLMPTHILVWTQSKTRNMCKTARTIWSKGESFSIGCLKPADSYKSTSTVTRAT